MGGRCENADFRAAHPHRFLATLGMTNGRQRVPSTEAYLMLSGTLFAVGLIGVIMRRNMITVLMAVELMLNAVNVNLVAFPDRLSSPNDRVVATLTITVAAGGARGSCMFRFFQSLSRAQRGSSGGEATHVGFLASPPEMPRCARHKLRDPRGGGK